MDIYHIWCDLKPGVRDMDFADRLEAYLSRLKEAGHVAGWRLSRRKLGLGAPGFPEFHVVIEFEGLAQMDTAFALVASREGWIEELHHGVNSLVTNVTFALYRDFPDAVRVRGQERF